MDIPYALILDGIHVDFVRYIIEDLEENGPTVYAFGYTHLQSFADAIQTAVCSYYGIAGLTYYVENPYQVDSLLYNTVVGQWDENFANYNCYAFAIGEDSTTDPGKIAWLDEGEDERLFLIAQDIEELANAARADLLSKGYLVLMPTTTMPSVTITEHERLICLRRGLGDFKDYHVMVLEKDGYWYHKPGTTHILRYNFVPSNDRVWVNEYAVNGVYYRKTNEIYDSVIYYIRYTIPCTYAYVYNSNETHIETCTGCGKTANTLACTYEYQYCGSGSHINTCTECGNTKGFILPCLYVNGRCQTCGRIESIIQQSIPDISQ